MMGVGYADTDVLIEQQTGRTIADIFATDGEQEFRRIEEDVVRTALATHDGVVSLGGGAVTTAGCARRWPGTPSSSWRSAPEKACGAPAGPPPGRCWPAGTGPRNTAP